LEDSSGSVAAMRLSRAVCQQRREKSETKFAAGVQHVLVTGPAHRMQTQMPAAAAAAIIAGASAVGYSTDACTAHNAGPAVVESMPLAV